MKPIFSSFFVSCLLHLTLFGAAMGLIAWGEAHADYRADIDMSNTPLLTLEAKPTPSLETWIQAKKGKAPKVVVQPTATPDTGGAVVASRQPSWEGGMITEDDYPVAMRREKKEGRVIVELLIDIGGYVKSVSILQGSTPEFNEVCVAKLKEARFRPALDKTGQPMNCRVRLPIAFKLN